MSKRRITQKIVVTRNLKNGHEHLTYYPSVSPELDDQVMNKVNEFFTGANRIVIGEGNEERVFQKKNEYTSKRVHKIIYHQERGVRN